MDELLSVNGNIKKNVWTNFENHKIYANWLKNKLGYKEMEDWYNITANNIRDNYGGGLTRHYYYNSPIQFLKAVFPEYKWLEWKFKSTAKCFWKYEENHKIYANWLKNELGYKEMEDWYNITANNIRDNYGGGLLSSYYDNSPIRFLKSVFPEYEWLEWKFIQTTKGFWKDEENHKKYAQWLGKKLGYTKEEDWYNITGNIIAENDGGGLLACYYEDSPIQFVKKNIFSESEWLEWKFLSTPSGFWKDEENHKIYANWLKNELGYKEMEDWYNITHNIVVENYGGGLLASYYNYSPIKFLKALFPEYTWLEWRFGMASLNTWNIIENHIKYAEWLGKKLEYTKEEDWYNITVKIMADNNIGGLLCHYYDNSPIQFLRGVFPDYEWIEWKFIQTPNHYWNDINNQKKYAKWLENKLGYTKREDWYKITASYIMNNCGGGLICNYNGSPIQFVKGVFPEYEWDEIKFCKHKTEVKLYDILLPIYPTIITQFKQEWCKNVRHLPFDFCIPEYKIIIDLDGMQHFQQVSNWSSPEEQFENDKYKEKCANDNNYSVIRIIQDDVLNDAYDWCKELCDAIEEIKNGDEIVNIYLCKNGEYDAF